MAAKGRKLSLLFVLAALLASTSLLASIPRSEMLTASSIDLRYESPSTSLADEDNSALLASALDAALPRPASLESLTETRVGALDVLAPFEQQGAGELTRALRKTYDFPPVERVADATFCAGDPVNFSDPTGNARRTRNGGSNWLGDWGDETNGGIGAWAVAKNTVGNTLSTALQLDVWADAVYVANDSSRSVKERAIAVAKGTGVAAVNLVGGQILGTAGKVVLKVPGAKQLVNRVANSAVGRVLATDVKVLTNRGAGSLNDLAGRAAPRSSGTPRINLANPANPQFGTDDLVYGPYGALVQRSGQRVRIDPTEMFRDRAGAGRLLREFKQPPGVDDWAQFSFMKMEETLAAGNKIHFDLTYVDNFSGVLGGHGPYANTVTAKELRYLHQNWPRFQDSVFFYRLNRRVAPW